MLIASKLGFCLTTQFQFFAQVVFEPRPLLYFVPIGNNRIYFRVIIFLLDGKKYEDICPSTHNMECPIVKRTEYQLIDIDDEGFCSLMDDTGETRDDLKPLEPELEKQIREKVDAGEDALVCVLKVYFQDIDVFGLNLVPALVSKRHYRYDMNSLRRI